MPIYWKNTNWSPLLLDDVSTSDIPLLSQSISIYTPPVTIYIYLYPSCHNQSPVLFLERFHCSCFKY